jgi:hypothetical protein
VSDSPSREEVSAALAAHDELMAAQREQRDMRTMTRSLGRLINEEELAEVHRIQRRVREAEENKPSEAIFYRAARAYATLRADLQRAQADLAEVTDLHEAAQKAVKRVIRDRDQQRERADGLERELERANGLLRRTKPYVSTWPNTEPLRLAVEAHLRGESTNRTAPATTNERALWIEYAALLNKNINELAGLHVAHGATKLASDEDIARGKELRRLLGIEGGESTKEGI